MTLKQARENAGKTVLEVAHTLRVSPQAVYRWENGEAIPTVPNLLALAKLYGYSVDDLLRDAHGGEVKT